MLRRHDLHKDICTPDIDPDDHICYITALCRLSHAHLGSYGNRRPRGGAGTHQNGRKRRPTTGCCMRPHRPYGLSARYTTWARSRPPLPLAAGHAARQADLLCLEEVFCAHGHARDRPDRSAVHIGQHERWQGTGMTRQRAQHTMVQGRRRGLAHTREVSLEYELGRVQKERRSEVERASDAEKTYDRIPT